jgi:hypothetical protein
MTASRAPVYPAGLIRGRSRPEIEAIGETDEFDGLDESDELGAV